MEKPISCAECRESRINSVPYIVYESDMARNERKEKRLILIIVLLIMLLVGTNVGWMCYESQFEDVVTTTYEADATDGGNAIANGEGNVTVNGESKDYNN